ncbi:MAG: hypothetical protein ABI905_12245 [Betaproteobacteria bacterium]
MSTTTLKISEALKLRIADVAQQAGKSAHAFMVDALESETRRAEMRSEFVQSALRAEQEVAQYGEVYAMDAVHQYFSDKLAGKTARRPKPSMLKKRS